LLIACVPCRARTGLAGRWSFDTEAVSPSRAAWVRGVRHGPIFAGMQSPRTNPARSARRSRAEWTADVVQWRKSGLGSAEYAAEHGLKRSSLLWWSSQLGPNTVERAAAVAPSTTTTFVPVRVREDRLGAEASGGTSNIEVVLCNGRRVRVTGTIDAAELARVLAAVEGGS
jgi:hypothetical protein